MTAHEAIASIREDIDRLEKKNLVKPGHIRRRRAELAAITDELRALASELMNAQQSIDQIQRESKLDAFRTGILANMLTILGIPWDRRIAYANEHEADVMERAARIASAHNVNAADSTTPKWKMLEAMRAAILSARLEIALEQSLPIITTNGKEEQERRAA